LVVHTSKIRWSAYREVEAENALGGPKNASGTPNAILQMTLRIATVAIKHKEN
jgi:predicted nucleotidyltransferase